MNIEYAHLQQNNNVY